jgi:hypothetical protein
MPRLHHQLRHPPQVRPVVLCDCRQNRRWRRLGLPEAEIPHREHQLLHLGVGVGVLRRLVDPPAALHGGHRRRLPERRLQGGLWRERERERRAPVLGIRGGAELGRGVREEADAAAAGGARAAGAGAVAGRVEPQLEGAVRERAGGPARARGGGGARAAPEVRARLPRVGDAARVPAPRGLARVRVGARRPVVAPRARAPPHLELVHHELVVRLRLRLDVPAGRGAGEVLPERGEELRRDLHGGRVGPRHAQRRRVDHEVLVVVVVAVGVLPLAARHACPVAAVAHYHYLTFRCPGFYRSRAGGEFRSRGRTASTRARRWVGLGPGGMAWRGRGRVMGGNGIEGSVGCRAIGGWRGCAGSVGFGAGRGTWRRGAAWRPVLHVARHVAASRSAQGAEQVSLRQLPISGSPQPSLLGGKTAL